MVKETYHRVIKGGALYVNGYALCVKGGTLGIKGGALSVKGWPSVSKVAPSVSNVTPSISQGLFCVWYQISKMAPFLPEPDVLYMLQIAPSISVEQHYVMCAALYISRAALWDVCCPLYQ